MKKIISLIVLTLCILTSSIFNIVKASDAEINPVGVDRIKEADILYGLDDTSLSKTDFKETIKEINDLGIVDSGTIKERLEFRAYRFGVDVTGTITFSGKKIVNYTAAYDNIIFYSVDIMGDDIVVKKCIPAAIKTEYGDTVSCQDIRGYTDYDVTLLTGYELSDLYTNYSIIHKLLLNYIYYQLEEEKNISINVSANKAPNITYLLDDLFDNYYLQYNNYIPFNNTVEIDTYKSIIYSFKNGRYIKYNLSIFAINKAIDISKLQTNIDSKITKTKLKEIIEEVINDNLNSLLILNDNYTDNYDKVGEYKLVILTKDNNEIYYYLPITILVINAPTSDDEPIVIATPKTTTNTPSSTSIPQTTSNIPSTTTIDTPQTSTKTTTTKTTPTVTTTKPNTSTIIPSTSSNVTTTTDEFKLEILNDIFEVSYKDYLSEEEIIDKLIFDSTNEIKSATVESKYFNKSNIVGEYDATVIVTDIFDNTSSKTLVISVFDDVKPVIMGTTFVTSISKQIKLSEIQNKLLATDEVDGEISNKNIKVVDLNNYAKSYQTPGSYQVEASVSDRSGNEAKAVFEIVVKDEDSYGSYKPNPTIILTNSSIITKRDIISYLQKNDYITTSNITITSQYFNTTEPDGEYELTIKENQEELKFTLSVYNGSLNKISNVIETNTNNYKLYYIIIGSSAGFVLLLALLGIITYRKKKNTK